jgi:hypothetical protein
MAEPKPLPASTAGFTTAQLEQGQLLKRLEQIRATLALIEARVGPYRPPQRPATIADRSFLPMVKRLVVEIEQSSDRVLRALKAMD